MARRSSPRVKGVVFPSRRSGGAGEFVGVMFEDGRAFVLPLDLFPTLRNAGTSARRHWRLIGGGQGVHWPDLDLDLSATGLLEARPEMTRDARRAFSQKGALMYLLGAMSRKEQALSTSQIADLLTTAIGRNKLRLVLRQAIEKRPVATRKSA